MLKTLLAVAITALTVNTASADFVRGYMKRDGTYVEPHWRSDANNTTLDNWSTRGNSNPYTGKRGTRDPYGNQYNNGW